MRVDAVQTENFRLLQGGRCEFSPGVNVIAGANAQGKTTLLEAVYMLTGAKSFRTYYDKELIAVEKDEAAVRGEDSRPRESSAWRYCSAAAGRAQ